MCVSQAQALVRRRAGTFVCANACQENDCTSCKALQCTAPRGTGMLISIRCARERLLGLTANENVAAVHAYVRTCTKGIMEARAKIRSITYMPAHLQLF